MVAVVQWAVWEAPATDDVATAVAALLASLRSLSAAAAVGALLLAEAHAVQARAQGGGVGGGAPPRGATRSMPATSRFAWDLYQSYSFISAELQGSAKGAEMTPRAVFGGDLWALGLLDLRVVARVAQAAMHSMPSIIAGDDAEVATIAEVFSVPA